MSYRCDACGNKTRFDVYETKKVRAFHHFTLAGDNTIEEEEVFSSEIEKIVCRWCGATEVTVLDGTDAGTVDPATSEAR
jgi:hypothetical protein